MYRSDPERYRIPSAIVIGAGFGGLAAAMRLRAAGVRVLVLEQHGWVGGKARTVASKAGPIDAGPTVLTMRHVFDALFQATGKPLEDCVTLTRQPILARHFWPDGSTLDLFDDREQSAKAIENFSNTREAKAFTRFSEEAEALFRLFDAPMMQTSAPRLGALARTALSSPRHLPMLTPMATLAGSLKQRFRDHRLRQLFGRYATYVGGDPQFAPALLSLIWHAEEAGVWRVSGGMHKLAEAMAERLLHLGADLRLDAEVAEITVKDGSASGVTLASGEILPADMVLFNGDPRALATRRLGGAVSNVGEVANSAPRSLSARVWSFAAKATGPHLTHHNVFFGRDPGAEFADLRLGRIPQDPTLYVCAEDRGAGVPDPPGLERFEIILNAAPITGGAIETEEPEICRQRTFQTLARFGLTFTPEPDPSCLSTPETFDRLFPGSAGSLYGQSPHGMTAALKRPRARTAIKGLYLAGGGTHPGAGVPMAALSGRHAAEAMT